MTVASQKVPGESATRAQRAQLAEHESDFEAVFVEHYPRVYGALFRLLGDRAEAEDLTLETFWRLWQRPPEALRRPAARGDDHLGGWLYRVAMRLGYNALRGAKRRARYEEQAGRDALERDAPPDPAHEVAQRQERERVRQTLKQMPEREAQLLILRHSGLSYKEIAAALGVAPASVGTLLARAEAEFEKLWSRAT